MEGLKMIVTAGSMRQPDGSLVTPSNPAVLSLNQVHHDDIPMPIPDGASPPFTWTLQPGGAHFDPPIRIEYPNMSGMPAGGIAYFLSFNHDTSRFEIVSSGHITADGSTVVTDPGGGLAVAGWGGSCPPYSAVGDAVSCVYECIDNGTLSGGDAMVDKSPVCVGEVVTFSVDKPPVDNGGLQRQKCVDKDGAITYGPIESIAPVAPLYDWTISGAGGFSVSGSGTAASFAPPTGSYFCAFAAKANRDCPPSATTLAAGSVTAVAVQAQPGICPYQEEGSAVAPSVYFKTEPPNYYQLISVTPSSITGQDYGITPFDVGIGDPLQITAKCNNKTVATVTVTPIDKSRTVSYQWLKIDYNVIKNILQNAQNIANKWGLGSTPFNVSGGFSAIGRHEICACGTIRNIEKISGTISAVFGNVSMTSPEISIHAGVNVKFSAAVSGTAAITASGETACNDDNVCGAVSGSVPISVTGYLCGLNCNVISLSAGGSTSVNVSGSKCTNGSGAVTLNLGGLTVSGSFTLATLQVFSYSHVAWPPSSTSF